MNWSTECWSVRYFRDRIGSYFFQRRHQDKPWLSRGAVLFLDQWLKESDRVLEFGSGRSTFYFARKCARVVSHEHHPDWGAKVEAAIKENGWSHVDVVQRADESYASTASSYADSSFDCILVDGVYRYESFEAALPKLAPGGIIVVDNINYFLPGKIQCPGGKAPTPRDEWDEESNLWQAALDALPRNWRMVRYCDGVIDTLVILSGGDSDA